MKESKNYKTSSEAIKDLHEQGYFNSFALENGKMRCMENNKDYGVNEMKIDQQFKFEGMSNPLENKLVCAVVCEDGVKGKIVSGYGIYADINLLNFIDELEMRMYNPALRYSWK